MAFKDIGQIAERVITKIREERGEPGKRGRGRPKGAVTKKPKAAAQPGTPDLRAWVGGLVPDDPPNAYAEAQEELKEEE